jgi:hypothetical protein
MYAGGGFRQGKPAPLKGFSNSGRRPQHFYLVSILETGVAGTSDIAGRVPAVFVAIL